MPTHDSLLAQQLLAHQAFLQRLAVELVGGEADDLVQEVWQRALERPPRFEASATGGPLRAWLARVARNLASNRWRGEARRVAREQDLAREACVEDELEERLAWRKELVSTLEGLDAPYREALLLRYFEGLAPRDIARRQGTPLATVKTRLRRGLEQLRCALDRRHGGERATWMSALAGIAAPARAGRWLSPLRIGATLMGTTMKVSVALLVGAACVWLVARPTREAAPQGTNAAAPERETALASAQGTPPEPDLEASVPAAPAAPTGRRAPITREPEPEASAPRAGHVLRVILDGVSEESARSATLGVVGLNDDERPTEVRASWASAGRTTEVALDAFLSELAPRQAQLRIQQLEVWVDHPLHFVEKVRLSLPLATNAGDAPVVHEVHASLRPPVYWPAVELAVRDADSRDHLGEVELRCVPTAFMGAYQRPGAGDPITLLGGRLHSPIALLGGRRPDGPEDWVAGLALGTAAGEAPRPSDLAQPEEAARGVVVYARAPGYAWGSLVVDLSTGARNELLLQRGAELDVRLSNVQLEGYAALEKPATLFVALQTEEGESQVAWVQPVDESLESEGVQLEGLVPGEYAISVELGGAFSWRTRPVLASEALSLAPGGERELVLHLPDPPPPAERATLAGRLSFPDIGDELEVSLLLYASDYRYGEADHELNLQQMQRVDGALPSWSFRFEDLAVDTYQLTLWPFLDTWIVELPEGGREDVELALSELAVVHVDTVDARNGERLPLEQIRFHRSAAVPQQVEHARATVGHDGEPGRFRFWTSPGAVSLQAWNMPRGQNYGVRQMELELVAGPQSVRLELAPPCAIEFEFRVDGAALPHGDQVYYDVLQGVRALDPLHAVIGLSAGYVEVSAAGQYAVDFEGVGAERFQAIPARRVDVRAGESTRVVIELVRK